MWMWSARHEQQENTQRKSLFLCLVPSSFICVSSSTSLRAHLKRKTPRKRRKKDMGVDDGESGSQNRKFIRIFVMKLFDRSVDFAQFSEDTPLYALARAWMQNKPYGTKLSDSQDGNLDGDSPSNSQESTLTSSSHSVSRKLLLKAKERTGKQIITTHICYLIPGHIDGSFPDPIKSVEDFDMNVCHPDEPLSLDIHYVTGSSSFFSGFRSSCAGLEWFIAIVLVFTHPTLYIPPPLVDLSV
ncbi:unnamed protein product [Porites evermanni]|uniref:Uncharacterized protein n=1 Tax=Porites evermanni TaxID=104178 RepID=A0ABN8LZ65_9CNID|nr:unnamed protein product [Porites evermanni]